MEKKRNKFKNNKKFWKWTANSLLLIIFGISAIINIAYLPKYFSLKAQQDTNNAQVLKINVSAYNSKDKENNIKLFTYIYQTTKRTLGNLMAQDQKTFHLIYSAGLGAFLDGITYYDDKNEPVTISSSNPYYWMIWQNGSQAAVGISDLRLSYDDNIELYYKSYQ